MEDLKILVDLCMEKKLSFSWTEDLNLFRFSGDCFEWKVDITRSNKYETAIKFLEEL